MKIGVIHHGMGNLHSVCHAVRALAPRAEIILSADGDRLRRTDRVILPGQGAMQGCMLSLRENNLIDVIQELVQKKPFLAICIGPQLLMEHSEENGGVDGLGLWQGEVKRFDFSELPEDKRRSLKIPHMGWNSVHWCASHPLCQGIDDGAFFYFVHSYYLQPRETSGVVAVCQHGLEFPAMYARDNVFGIQAHPEKSGVNGLKLLENFIRWHI